MTSPARERSSSPTEEQTQEALRGAVRSAERTAPGPPSRGPRWLSSVLWPLAALTYLHTVLVSLDRPVTGDFRIIQAGAAAFVAGEDVYSAEGYVFTPSGLLLTSWLGVPDAATARVLLTLGSAVLVPVAGAVCLALAGRSWRGPLGAGTLLLLSVSESVAVTMLLGNINVYLGALLAVSLLLYARGRRTAAGVVLGLALALKPVMLLLLIVPVLRRWWVSAAAAVVVPAVLNVAGLALVSAPSQLFTTAVPYLLQPRETPNSSLWAAGVFLGVDPAVTLLVRVLVVVAAAVVLWRTRSQTDLPLWLAVSSGVLMLATFLAASLAEAYWSILLLPLLASVVRPGSPMRSWVAWVGVYLFATMQVWRLGALPELETWVLQLRPTTGWLLLLAVVVVWGLRRPSASRADRAEASVG